MMTDNITVRISTLDSPELDEIRSLYERAFPEIERIDFENIYLEKGREVLSFFVDDEFVGFAANITVGEISHITFFAVEESYRSKGIGSKLLKLIYEYKYPNRIIVDCENENEVCDNREERISRKKFYFKNGYNDSGVSYSWRGVKYDMLVIGGSLTTQELTDFWGSFGFYPDINGNYD